MLAVAANLILSMLLWEKYAHEGLAFSVSAAAWVEWALLYWLYVRKTGAPGSADLRAMGLVLTAGAGMALFLAVAMWPLDLETWQQNLVAAVAGAAAGGVVYVAICYALHIEELTEVVAQVRSGLRRVSSARA